MRCRVLVLLAVAVAVTFTVPALGDDGPLQPLAKWGTGEEVGPHVESIAAAQDGSIVVADRKRDRVVRFDPDHALAGGFRATDPRGIAIVSGGYLVSEPGQVRRTDVNGTTMVTYPAKDPYGVALAGDTVLIADAAHGRILRYRLDGAELPAWDADLVAPRGLAIGRDGTVYVADAGRWRIETFNAGGNDTGGWRVPDPHGVAVDAASTVFVATHHHGKLLWFDSKLNSGAIGGFTKPRAVAVDCRGTVTVADNSTPRLSSFSGAAPCVAPLLPPPPPPRPVVPGAPPPPVEQPELGTTAALVPVSGTVYVGDGDERRVLRARRIVPVETLIDATDGQVELTFETFEEDAAKYGPFQHGVFQDGAFTIHQGRNDSLVELRLHDEEADVAGAGAARIAARRKRRRVWGSATGEFRTSGRHGAATVRGTRWLTEERPAGTFFKVTEGIVLAEAFQRDQRRLLHPGESFLARPACVSRRNFRIRLRVPPGTTIRRARVRVAGRRVKVRYAARVTAPVDLRGLPRGSVTVRIRVVTGRGTVLRGVRTYQTCAAPDSSDSLPEL